MKRSAEDDDFQEANKAVKIDEEEPAASTPVTDSVSQEAVTEPKKGNNGQHDRRNDKGGRGGKKFRGGGRGGQQASGVARDGRNWGPRDGDGADTADKGPRIPKRKVALLMAYCGTGYQGMQSNAGIKSIEGDLWKALVAAPAISADNASDPKKVSFSRAARTDKGVHALGQVCSLKMSHIDDPGLVTKINSHLPDQIRVLGFVRTVKSFNAKNNCDSRIYEYLLPTYVFIPPHPLVFPNSKVASDPPGTHPLYAFPFPEAGAGEAPYMQPSTSEAIEAKRAYRISQEELAHLREILNGFQGTKNHHNFTVGKKFEDMSARRYIMSFKASEPFVKDGIEWLSLKIQGQSFMLHQIRKMVGLAILMVRTQTPLIFQAHTFKSTKFNIPKAPSLGLLLQQVVYDKYNEKQRKAKQQYETDLSFTKFEAQIEAFKDEHITSAMVREETKNKVFDEWCRIIDSHPNEFRWFLKADGSCDESERPKQSEVEAFDKEEDDVEGGDDDAGGDNAEEDDD